MKFVGILLLFAITATAQTTQMILVKPGGPASTKKAETTLEKFSEVLFRLSKTKVQMTYFPDEAPGIDFIQKNKPKVAAVSTAFYLKHKQKYDLQIRLQVHQQQQTKKTYIVVVPQNSPMNDVRSLKGKVIASNHLYEAELLSALFLGNKNQLSKEYQLKLTTRPFTVMRRMFKGQINAVILDSFQEQTLLPLFTKDGKKVKIIARSKAIPTMPVVTLGKYDSSIFLGLTKLQQDQEGKKLLELFQIDTFGKADLQAFAELEKFWQVIP